jgi:hypothetical protein
MLPRLAETKTSLCVHTVVLELNLDGLPNNVIHVMRISSKDEVTVKLNAVPRVMLCSAVADLSGCSSQMCH